MSYRYYRFLATDASWFSSNGGYYQVAYEAELYASSDLSGSPIAISDATADCQYSGYGPSYLIDGIDSNLNLTWRSCTVSSPHYFELDCGDDIAIGSARVRYYSTGTNLVAPKSLKIQGKVDGGSSYADLQEISVSNSTADNWVEFASVGGGAAGFFPLINGFGRAGKLVS